MDLKLILLVALLPIGAFSQRCYRCFGNNYCNNPLDTDHAVIVACDGGVNATVACMTTHYVEARETHTMRVCVSNINLPNVTTCDRIRNSIFGVDGNATGFYCNTCTTDLCNNGTAIPAPEGEGEGSGATVSNVSYLAVLFVTVFACFMK